MIQLLALMKKTKLIVLLSFLGMAACQSDKSKKITADDVPEVDAPVILYHDLVADSTSRTQALIDHQRLSTILFHHIAGVPLQDTAIYREGVNAFLDDEVTHNIYLLIDSVYSDWSSIKNDWKQSMGLFHHYFPEEEIPVLYSLQSNLGIANFMFIDDKERDAVGVSLDFFLGKAYPYLSLSTENPVFSDYNNRTFNPDHVVSKSLTAVLDDMVPEVTTPNFLHYMIREGKKLYVMDQICPHLQDTVIFEMTPEQLAWCNNNEYEMWNFFLEKNLIYETTMSEVMKYMQAAPSSSGMPKESPGRTAPFIGYKIVERYMTQHPGTDLKYLLSMHNAQEFLDAAKYKPRSK